MQVESVESELLFFQPENIIISKALSQINEINTITSILYNLDGIDKRVCKSLVSSALIFPAI